MFSFSFNNQADTSAVYFLTPTLSINTCHTLQKLLKTLFLSILVVLIPLIQSSAGLNAQVYGIQRYWSVLESSKNVSATDANGLIGIKFTDDFKRLIYNVNLNNIDNITGIYLYNKGDNQTIILDLLKEAKEAKVKDKFKETSNILASPNEVEGTVAVGGVTSDDMGGVLSGKSLKALYGLVNGDEVYVVVTTNEYPRGEIFGNEFIPTERFFPDTTDFDWS